MYKTITNSYINGLSTLDATFTEFLHAWLTVYSTGANKVGVKPKIYRSGSDSLKMANKSKNSWSFGAHLLPVLEFFFDVAQFNVFVCFKSEGN